MMELTGNQRDAYRQILKDSWKGPFECSLIVKYPTEDNCYDSISDWASRYGIYKFVDEMGKTAYVGQAHLQELATRVKQHLRPRDGGGDFRIAVEAKLGTKDKTMRYIRGCTLWFIETPPKESLVFEALASLELDPLFSGYTWRKAQSIGRKGKR